MKNIIKLHYLPSVYWYVTRLKSKRVLFSVIFKELGLMVFMFIVVVQPTPATLPLFLAKFVITWLMFISLYEIGYLKNDLVAVRKENNPTIRITEDYTDSYPLFIHAKVMGAIVFFLVLRLIAPAEYLKLAAIPLGVFFINIVHNIVPVKYRPATFFSMRLGKNNIIAPLIPDFRSLLIYVAAMTISPLASTISYVSKKKTVSNQNSKYLEFYISVLLLLASFAFSYRTSEIFGYYLAYYVCWQIVISGLKYGSAACKIGKEPVLYHVHTDFSHDGELTVEQISSIFKEKEAVYIADHAEDMGAEKFERLKKQCSMYSRKDFVLAPGLEYSTKDGDHLLALSMKSFILPENSSTLECIQRLRSCCGMLVWAHPSFSIKKLIFDRDYRMERISIGRNVTAVELINLRLCRSVNHRIRSFIIGVIAYLCFGKRCIIGADFHSLKDNPARFLKNNSSFTYSLPNVCKV